jgi:hypothetical protein
MLQRCLGAAVCSSHSMIPDVIHDCRKTFSADLQRPSYCAHSASKYGLVCTKSRSLIYARAGSVNDLLAVAARWGAQVTLSPQLFSRKSSATVQSSSSDTCSETDSEDCSPPRPTVSNKRTCLRHLKIVAEITVFSSSTQNQSRAIATLHPQ